MSSSWLIDLMLCFAFFISWFIVPWVLWMAWIRFGYPALQGMWSVLQRTLGRRSFQAEDELQVEKTHDLSPEQQEQRQVVTQNCGCHENSMRRWCEVARARRTIAGPHSQELSSSRSQIEQLLNGRLQQVNQPLDIMSFSQGLKREDDQRNEEPPPSYDEIFASPLSKTSQSAPHQVGVRQETISIVDDQDDDQRRGLISQRVSPQVAKQFTDPFLSPKQRSIIEIISDSGEENLNYKLASDHQTLSVEHRSHQSPFTALPSDTSPSTVLQSVIPFPSGTYESLSKPGHTVLEMIEETPSLQGGQAPLNETDTWEVESADVESAEGGLLIPEMSGNGSTYISASVKRDGRCCSGAVETKAHDSMIQFENQCGQQCVQGRIRADNGRPCTGKKGGEMTCLSSERAGHEHEDNPTKH